jgi:hypothetical protein
MTNRVPLVPPLRKVEIEARAAQIIRRFDPDGFNGKCPVNIEAIFDFDLKKMSGLNSLVTDYRDLSVLGGGVYGYTDASSMTSVVHSKLIDDETENGHRLFRSTVAHESAHCVLHIPVLSFFKSILADGSQLYRAKRHDIPAYLDPEWQAWTLGGAMLMPKHLMEHYYGQGVTIYTLAGIFNVNPAFVRERLRIIGLVKK